MATPKTKQGFTLPNWVHYLARHRGLIVPVGFVMLLVVILVPLPAAALDILISANISLAVIILLTTLYMNRALDFSVFPSLLLATTLLRLVLNIASTRLILTADASTPDEAMGVAGEVISAFGRFVAGDSLFVGMIIFGILMIVQFMVVTKGAGRISEVAARFTLDAMPGKQMAIDSELSAGVISEEEAKEKREDIAREADFYGAMDGASKFVRGDAVAGILITAINLAGGFATACGSIDNAWGYNLCFDVRLRRIIHLRRHLLRFRSFLCGIFLNDGLPRYPPVRLLPALRDKRLHAFVNIGGSEVGFVDVCRIRQWLWFLSANAEVQCGRTKCHARLWLVFAFVDEDDRLHGQRARHLDFGRYDCG